MDINRKIIEISSVDSTNKYANELLKSQKLEEETIIWAKSQFNGKGQKGNHWHSEKGKNITISIVLSPDFLAIEKQFYLSIITSLAIYDTFKKFSNQITIKWPNDIYANKLKLGGILVENSISGSIFKNSVIGIGININQTKFPEDLPNPVSLLNITGKVHNLEEIIIELAKKFHQYYEQLKISNFEKLRQNYKMNLIGMGEYGRYKDKKGEFAGEIIDVEETGELVIRDSDGSIRKYLFKEVEFI